MIYLFVFFSSGSLIWLSEHVKGSNKFVRNIMIFMAIMLPSLLAALRDQSIGTDLRVYGISVFQSSINADKFSDLQFLSDWYGIETGYRLLNYIVSRITEHIEVVLFALQFLVLELVINSYVYIKDRLNSHFSIAFAAICFYLLFYNENLNLLRQSLAMAVIVYGCKFLYEDKKIMLVITVLIAMQFHMTAIIGAAIYVLYYLIAVNKNLNFVKIGYILCLAGIFFIPFFLRLFLSFNFFGGKYSERYNLDNGISVAITQLLIRIPFILLLLYQSIKNNEKRFCYLYYSLILMLDLVFAELRSANTTLYRLSLYFSWLKPLIYYEISDYYRKKEKRIVQICIIFFLIALWIYQIVYQGNGETFPYKFNFH